MSGLRDRLTYEEVKEMNAQERLSWTQYETVRDALALGFWPDAYGNVGSDTSLLRPPTKFFYPRAGVASPAYANGVAAGADLCVFTHRGGSPDDLRNESCWLICIHDMGGVLWDMKRANRQLGRAFDDAVGLAIAMGDEVRRQYIVPDYDPDTRIASMPVRHWRELAALELAERPGSLTLLQLDMFENAKPRKKSRMESAQEQVRAALERCPEYDADDALSIEICPFDVCDLVKRANNARERCLVGAA